MGLGTAAIGNLYSPVGEGEAGKVVSAARDKGLCYFDTAPLYGYGLAEQRLGRALEGVDRDEVIVSTKVGRLLRAGAPPDASQYSDGEPFYKATPPVEPVWDFSYDGVLTSVAESCQRLHLDRLDMLLLHDPDSHFEQAKSSAYEALLSLRANGMTKAIGAGMNQTEVLTGLVEQCQLDVVLLAGRYTLLDQSALDDLLPACARNATAVVIGGVFNSGVLAEPAPGAHYDYLPVPEAVQHKALRLEAICSSYDVPLPAAALQFPLAHPSVTSVLLGCRSVAELEMDLAWLQLELPDRLWADLRREGLLRPDAPVPGERSDQ